MATTTLNKRAGSVRPSRARLERYALDLSKRCPADASANPVDCPLFGLRLLPIRERRAWIQRLSDEELEYLQGYHACCLALKTASQSRSTRKAKRRA